MTSPITALLKLAAIFSLVGIYASAEAVNRAETYEIPAVAATSTSIIVGFCHFVSFVLSGYAESGFFMGDMAASLVFSLALCAWSPRWTGEWKSDRHPVLDLSVLDREEDV